MKKNSKDKIFASSLILPAAVMLCLTIILPLVEVIRMSFYNYSLLNLNQAAWNNFKNYRILFTDPEFGKTFIRTLYYVSVTVILDLLAGFTLALLLNRAIKGRNFLRGLLFLPWTFPTLVVAVVWLWIYQPQYGIFNYLLQTAHLITKNINWLGQMNTAMAAVIVAAVWKQTPLVMVMILAGLQTVSKDYEEAAMIDGATATQKFFKVTLPCIMGVVKAVSLISIITNFQMFVLFFTMTGGGPVRATTTLATYAYESAFMQFNLGKGAAVGVTWLVFLTMFTWVFNKILANKEAFAD
jgi:multiple sugar transport system permease protein